MMERTAITPEQAVRNAIIACRVEALRARARGTHTIADEWDGHASTIRDLEARLAEAEKRKVLCKPDYPFLSITWSEFLREVVNRYALKPDDAALLDQLAKWCADQEAIRAAEEADHAD